MRIVTAVYERDPQGSWLAHLAEEPRCHTWGRSLPAARQGIRDAIELWTEELGVSDASDLDVRDDVRVPHADEALKLASRRVRLAKELADLRAEDEQLAGMLLGEGLSVRDVAALVGLTPGRISQIAPGAGRRETRRAS
jgi:predicted RNase H-like HicB family nuclease